MATPLLLWVQLMVVQPLSIPSSHLFVSSHAAGPATFRRWCAIFFCLFPLLHRAWWTTTIPSPKPTTRPDH
ncbi:MAG: hypothetical protein J3Q66DRAFT_359350 [Benniella sp.]|nr:MAG: hypothetical protein J3Q66DRAFT_359350 [Benniella sp.]